MEFNDINTFLDYYAKIKNRTRRLFNYIPPTHIKWTYQEGKFTIGDIIRHLANIERLMYAENVQQMYNKNQVYMWDVERNMQVVMKM